MTFESDAYDGDPLQPDAETPTPALSVSAHSPCGHARCYPWPVCQFGRSRKEGSK